MENKVFWLHVVVAVLGLTCGTLAGLTHIAFAGLAPLVIIAGVLTAGVCGAIAVLQYKANQIPIFASLTLLLALVGSGIWSLVLITP